MEEKRGNKLVQVSVRETNESEPLSVVETRSVYLTWDKSAGCLMTERTATGVEGA